MVHYSIPTLPNFFSESPKSFIRQQRCRRLFLGVKKILILNQCLLSKWDFVQWVVNGGFFKSLFTRKKGNWRLGRLFGHRHFVFCETKTVDGWTRGFLLQCKSKEFSTWQVTDPLRGLRVLETLVFTFRFKHIKRPGPGTRSGPCPGPKGIPKLESHLDYVLLWETLRGGTPVLSWWIGKEKSNL